MPAANPRVRYSIVAVILAAVAGFFIYNDIERREYVKTNPVEKARAAFQAEMRERRDKCAYDREWARLHEQKLSDCEPKANHPHPEFTKP